MIVELFFAGMLCSMLGMFCPEDNSEMERVLVYKTPDSNYIKIKINSTDESMYDLTTSTVMVNGISWELGMLNNTVDIVKFKNDTLEYQSNLCKDIGGSFVYYWQYDKHLCDISTVNIPSQQNNSTVMYDE